MSLSKMNIEGFATKMDKIGALVFLYVIVYSIIKLRSEVDALTVILLLVGIGGFLVDLFIVTKTSSKK